MFFQIQNSIRANANDCNNQQTQNCQCCKLYHLDQCESLNLQIKRVIEITMEQQGIQVLQTFSGCLQVKDLKEITLCIIYQSLNGKKMVEKSQKSQKQLNLANLMFIRENPFTIENTSITPSLLQNQIHQINPNNILIVDSSIKDQQSSQSKGIPDIFKNYRVAKGYQYPFKRNLKKEQYTPSLYQLDFIIKDIRYEFELGNGVYKPAFIGEIDLYQMMQIINDGPSYQKEFMVNILKSYFVFSSKTKCPIFFNCLGKKTNGYSKSILGMESLTIKQSMNDIYSFIHYILEILQQVQQINKINLSLGKNLYFLNLPIYILLNNKEKGGRNFLSVENLFNEQLMNLRQKYKMMIGYELLRYNDDHCLVYIGSQLSEFKGRTIVSAGVRFKTDLLNYGGEGILLKQVKQKINYFYPQLKIDEIVVQNFITLLSWKFKKQIIIQVTYWKCEGCKKEFEESVEAFKKFGKIFCSIACLKSNK